VTAALADQALQTLREAFERLDSEEEFYDATEVLAKNFRALDGWISAGGALPGAWRMTSPRGRAAMTAALTGRGDRQRRARELYAELGSLRQVGAELGVSHTTVRFLLAGGEPAPRQRHLRVVPDASRAAQPVLRVSPERAAIAYSTGRGWHITQTPPGWFLDLLADLD